MVKTTNDSELLALLQKALHPGEQSPYANKTIITDITAPSAPQDYESTKHKVAQREFVKNLADKSTERINTELIPQLQNKFNEHDELIAKNNEKLDNLSYVIEDTKSTVDKIADSFDITASNEWT